VSRVADHAASPSGLNIGSALWRSSWSKRASSSVKNAIDASQAWFWTDEWQPGEREASGDIAGGRVCRELLLRWVYVVGRRERLWVRIG